MDRKEVEIEIEMKVELLTIITAVAQERGISAEQWIAEIIQQYISQNDPHARQGGESGAAANRVSMEQAAP